MRKSLDSGDVKQAHQIAHTLKGTAALLGATTLSEAAWAVEQPLEDGKTVSEDLIERLKTALEAVLDELESAGVQKQGAATSEPPFDRNETIRLLDQLELLLEAGSSKSVGLLKGSGTILSPLGEDAELLCNLVAEYDFEPALEALQRLRERLNSQT